MGLEENATALLCNQSNALLSTSHGAVQPLKGKCDLKGLHTDERTFAQVFSLK